MSSRVKANRSTREIEIDSKTEPCQAKLLLSLSLSLALALYIFQFLEFIFISLLVDLLTCCLMPVMKQNNALTLKLKAVN